MANKTYKLNDNNVNFYVKPEITFSIGNKLIYAKYNTNENGDVTWHKPIINAIDIDWQNAVTDEITDAINTSGKLISIISNNKKSIRLTNESIESIITQIGDIENTLDNISNIIDDSQPLTELKESLRLLSNRVTAIEEGHIDIDLSEIQNSIDNINNSINTINNNISNQNSIIDNQNSIIDNQNNIIDSINNYLNSTNERIDNLAIPKYVSELLDGYDVLRISTFETIKNELKGESAYEIAKRTAQQNGTPFPYITEAEWLESLKGKDGKDGQPGTNGKSAFQIAQDVYRILGKDFPYNNESEWMEAIISGGSDNKTYVDQKIKEAIDLILGDNDINESFDTIKEISEWILEHPDAVQMVNDIEMLKDKTDDLLGNVIEEYEDPDTHNILTRIKQFTNGTLNGQSWATSIEQINSILNNVSFAENVENNAEANKIDELNFMLQDARNLTGDDLDEYVQFGSSNLDTESKVAGISLNINLLEKIQQYTLDLSDINAQRLDTTILETAKTYTDEKTSWTIL